jgi:hypothetical protein
MAKISVKVIVDNAHMGQTKALCASLTRMGMTVETTMPEIGVIFGSAEESLLPKLSSAKGVERATVESAIHLPPRDGKLPQ